MTGIYAAPIPIRLYRITEVIDQRTSKPKLDEAGHQVLDKATEPEDFLFSPLSEMDIDTLDTWIRRRHIQIVRGSFEEGMTQEEKDAELRVAYNQASTLSWLSPLGARLMASIDGMSYLSWISLRKQHPDITRRELMLMMSDGANLREISAALEASGELKPFPPAQGAGKTKPSKRTTPKQRSKRLTPSSRKTLRKSSKKGKSKKSSAS